MSVLDTLRDGLVVSVQPVVNTVLDAGVLLMADCVTVGSAITRLEHVVGWFDEAIRDAGP